MYTLLKYSKNLFYLFCKLNNISLIILGEVLSLVLLFWLMNEDVSREFFAVKSDVHRHAAF